jgi:DNA polymerase-3 subunit alpha
MKAVAVTDHGNMFGAISFYKAAKDAGVQAILGCELEVTRAGTRHHLPLLAATLEGYKNLVWLVLARARRSPTRAPAGRPFVSLDDVASPHEGARRDDGLHGRARRAGASSRRGRTRGRESLGALRDVFEPGALYVELQDHGLPEQPVLNGILVDMARELDLPLVATNDVHYAEREDAEAHLYLSCIKTGRSLRPRPRSATTARARCT